MLMAALRSWGVVVVLDHSVTATDQADAASWDRAILTNSLQPVVIRDSYAAVVLKLAGDMSLLSIELGHMWAIHYDAEELSCVISELIDKASQESVDGLLKTLAETSGTKAPERNWNMLEIPTADDYYQVSEFADLILSTLDQALEEINDIGRHESDGASNAGHIKVCLSNSGTFQKIKIDSAWSHRVSSNEINKEIAQAILAAKQASGEFATANGKALERLQSGIEGFRRYFG